MIGALNYLKKYNVKQIGANYFLGNFSSANVLNKNGFIEVGTTEVYSLSLKKTVTCVQMKYNKL